MKRVVYCSYEMDFHEMYNKLNDLYIKYGLFDYDLNDQQLSEAFLFNDNKYSNLRKQLKMAESEFDKYVIDALNVDSIEDLSPNEYNRIRELKSDMRQSL